MAVADTVAGIEAVAHTAVDTEAVVPESAAQEVHCIPEEESVV